MENTKDAFNNVIIQDDEKILDPNGESQIRVWLSYIFLIGCVSFCICMFIFNQKGMDDAHAIATLLS